MANGICIRLYDEKDFAGRPRFTDPEILRSSLAGVILRMKALRLGTVEDFPFLEAPPRKAIADGYALLGELGAVDDDNELTPIGQRAGPPAAGPARRPHDPGGAQPRGAERGADHRLRAERPGRARPAAGGSRRPPTRSTSKFDDEKSEFMGYLKLWQWIEEGRGVHGHAEAASSTDSHKLSNRQQEQRLRDSFVSPRRVREWRDIHIQLHTVVAEHGWRLNASPATYEQVHLAMLAGLLGNIGCKSDDEDWYLGARGIKFWRHPGAHLSKKPGRWLVAAELVETTRLFGRGLAAIEPQWIPPHRRPPAEDAAARAALGEEGRRGDRAGARHALRHRHLQQPARELRQASTRRRRARSSSARRWCGGELGDAAALPGAQPQADRSRSRSSSTSRAGRTCWSTTS